VVLSHGMGDHRATFRLLVPLLVAGGYRVATVDVRGHGESSTGWPTYAPREVGADLVALVRHLGGPAVLVGSSSSAAAVPYAAVQSPADVSGIVLLSPFVARTAMKFPMNLVAKAVMANSRLWIMYYKTLFPAAKPADFETYLRDLRADLKRSGRMQPVSGVVAPTAEHWTEVAPDIHCPVLVLMGTKDPDFPDPEAEARRAQELFAGNATLHLIDDSGHYPYQDAPQATAAALEEFLKGVTIA
jgi:pimeloyl-ACP methyl ester carboxylesterase